MQQSLINIADLKVNKKLLNPNSSSTIGGRAEACIRDCRQGNPASLFFNIYPVVGVRHDCPQRPIASVSVCGCPVFPSNGLQVSRPFFTKRRLAA